MPAQQLPSEEILTDLVARFIFNVPDCERNTFERLMFLVEQAHWHYEDCIVDRNRDLKSLHINEFTALIFENTPGLEEYKELCPDILRDWQAYKSIVPVYGAILLDPPLHHCLLVRGYKSGSGWGFPRGKVAKDEEGPACAIREVKEETGFDISALIKPNEYIEVLSGNQTSRLYIIPGVDRRTCFAPQVKKEIGGFAWHSVDELPVDRDDANQVFLTEKGQRHRFFMVWPFVKQLRKWIAKQRRAQQQQHNAAASSRAVAGLSSPAATKSQSRTPGALNTTMAEVAPGHGAAPASAKDMKHSKSTARLKAADRKERTASGALHGDGATLTSRDKHQQQVHDATGASSAAPANQHADISTTLPGYQRFVPAQPEVTAYCFRIAWLCSTPCNFIKRLCSIGKLY